MRGEVLVLVNIPNSHFLLSLTHSALGHSVRVSEWHSFEACELVLALVWPQFIYRWRSKVCDPTECSPGQRGGYCHRWEGNHWGFRPTSDSKTVQVKVIFSLNIKCSIFLWFSLSEQLLSSRVRQILNSLSEELPSTLILLHTSQFYGHIWSLNAAKNLLKSTE